jgi:hypothetical protein
VIAVNVLRVKFTIGTSWAHNGYSGEVEIPAEDLEGLSAEARESFIAEVISDEVDNLVSWGWIEVGDGET